MFKSNSVFLKTGILILLYCGIAYQNKSFAQPDKTTRHAWMIYKMAKEYHYQPKKVNDEFGFSVLAGLINNLDSRRIYFTHEDIDTLRSLAVQIDNDILFQKDSFISAVRKLYIQKIDAIDQLIQDITPEEISFDKNEVYSNQKVKKFVFEEEFRSLWVRRLKSQILLEHYEKIDSIERKTAPTSENIKALLITIKSRETCRIKMIRNTPGGIEEWVNQNYLKAVANGFDPHTVYFSNEEENQFQELLSKESRSFGIEFYRNENGETAIAAIAPGSQAWKSGELNQEDVVIKVKGLASEIMLDCFATSDLEAFLMNPELDDATFYVRKKNGDELNINFTKEVLTVEDNLIESFVLHGENKIGYIYLPSFYSDDEEFYSHTKGCSSDIAKALQHLNKEGVEGLILDVRNNGGGSMLEAILLSGIFIDYGTITISDHKYGGAENMKDLIPGKLFKQPLIVLVNDYSASASELFAAAIQDYNRGVIVGSTTYGKSTSQQVLPLDYFLFDDYEREEIPIEAYIKLTTGAFYRPTGISHQRIGVIPNIPLPSYYTKLNRKESAEPNVLSFSKIDKTSYFVPQKAYPIEQLAKLSNARIEASAEFNYIKNQSVVIANRRENMVIPLRIAEFEKFYFEKEDEFEFTDTPLFKVRKPAISSEIINTENLEQKIDQAEAKEIKNDTYVIESYLIMRDILKLKDKNE